MSSEPPPKKRLPLRWLTLAEIVGVAALAIAGLGYWDSHRERLQQDQDRVAAERRHNQLAREARRRSWEYTYSGPRDIVDDDPPPF